MLGNAPAVAPKPAALPPAAPPAQPGAGTAGGLSFAHFLNDQPAPAPDQAQADPAPTTPDTPKPSTAPAPAQPARKEATATPTDQANQAQPPARSARPADEAEARDDDATVTNTPADAEPDAQASGLDEFTQLIGLALPVAAPPAAPVEDADTQPARRSTRAARAVDDDRLAPAAARRSGSDDAQPATDRRPAADTARAKGAELAADKATASRGDTPQITAPADPRAAAAPIAPPASFAAVLAQAQPAGTLPGAAPAAAATPVQAALHSPAFAPELGARVSLLAVGGVQQAELQLNPADMGPVAVRIVVDGGQAQVSFHAAQAETRQALQQSLPELAAALQGQGLTLSGGGVFQQAPQDAQDNRGGEAQASDGRHATAGDATADGSDAAPPPTRRSVGLLDAFA